MHNYFFKNVTPALRRLCLQRLYVLETLWLLFQLLLGASPTERSSLMKRQPEVKGNAQKNEGSLFVFVGAPTLWLGLPTNFVG
jgi:hypothetical protein